MTYLTLKTIHMAMAMISLAGFVVRGIWMLRNSSMQDKKLVRVLPHLIDTLLLASAIGMLFLLRPAVPPWLYVKVPGVLAYIILGSFALKRARTTQVRIAFLLTAIAVFVWIASVALTKSAWGFFSMLIQPPAFS